MKNKPDAKATIESAIMDGLSKNAHITGAKANVAHIQVADILEAIFAKPVRWAVIEYLEETDIEAGVKNYCGFCGWITEDLHRHIERHHTARKL